MKFLFLVLLLLCSGTANSDDTKEQAADSQSPKKGDDIWLEEKISPTTTWLENLVKPLTIWMEQKINVPDQTISDDEGGKATELNNTLERDQTVTENATKADSFINAEQAGLLANQHIAGEVLYIKLISQINRYRVKLISKVGEIHVIYVDATSGNIVLRDQKLEAKQVNQIGAQSENQANLPGESTVDDREQP